MKEDVKIRIGEIGHTPGVYQFFNEEKKLLYIGKAVDLKNRVSQYFLRPQSERISQMVERIADIKIIQTDTNIEALILEANLINKYQPLYNILLKDDKTFGGIFITDEGYPRVFLARITDQLPKGEWFGPYVHGKERQIALKVLRKIFKWCNAPGGANLKLKTKNSKLQLKTDKPKPCFYYHIGLCSGACIGAVTKLEYRRQIRHLKMFLKGEKKKLLKKIESEMKHAARLNKFENAQRLKEKLAALNHIQESAFVVMGDSPITQTKSKLSAGGRIEGYDIANIANDSIVGGMVVFTGGKPDTNQYRQFKIRTIKKQNDVAAMAEMVERRFTHSEWTDPDLILVDGGIGQVAAVRQIIHYLNKIIPVVGIAKGQKRDKNELVGDVSFVTANKILLKTLIQVRDEAHRFARRYFFVLRTKQQIKANSR